MNKFIFEDGKEYFDNNSDYKNISKEELLEEYRLGQDMSKEEFEYGLVFVLGLYIVIGGISSI